MRDELKINNVRLPARINIKNDYAKWTQPAVIYTLFVAHPHCFSSPNPQAPPPPSAPILRRVTTCTSHDYETDRRVSEGVIYFVATPRMIETIFTIKSADLTFSLFHIFLHPPNLSTRNIPPPQVSHISPCPRGWNLKHAIDRENTRLEDDVDIWNVNLREDIEYELWLMQKYPFLETWLY